LKERVSKGNAPKGGVDLYRITDSLCEGLTAADEIVVVLH
jgi:hypothetical protein